MSLALSLNPCEGFKLGNDYFRPGDFDVSTTVTNAYGNWICRVFASQTWYTPNNCFIKHNNGGGGFNLAIGGRVWLDVWTYTGAQFERGGYLEEIEYTYYFDTVPLRFHALGVRAAPYTGGVKIEGLNSSNQWTAHGFGPSGGEAWASFSEPFVFSGRRQSFVSFRAEGYSIWDSTGPRLYALVPGILADEVRYDCYPSTST